MKPAMIVLGIDGATFDVIKPLVAAGSLPNIAKLLQNGAHGPLESIVPPITGPAWSVIATGKNPGKLGVFDFINRTNIKDYNQVPIRSHYLEGQAYWDILNTHGRSTGILNYPMLIPAYPVNGWMIAGLGASRLHAFTYPENLKENLDRITGHYEINVSFGLPKYKANLALLVEDIKKGLWDRVAVLEELLQTHPVDVLTFVIFASDVASHVFWGDWAAEDAEISSNPLVEQRRDLYRSIWEDIDRAVGQVLSYLLEDGHAIILSDHGFGANHGVFYLNTWLAENGFLKQKETSASFSNAVRTRLIQWTTPFLGGIYKRILGSKAHQFLRASILREIDLDDTRAFMLDNSDTFGGIFINRSYAMTRGLNEAAFVAEMKQNIQGALAAFGQKAGMEITVHDSASLYHGDKSSLAPDLMVVIDNYRCSFSHKLNNEIFIDQRYHPMKTGTHRMEGIFIGTGPKIAPGEVSGATLQDIVPTLLFLNEVPIPASLDGRILTEILVPQAAASVEAFLELSGRQEVRASRDTPADAEDMEAVRQRLIDLGYLD